MDEEKLVEHVYGNVIGQMKSLSNGKARHFTTSMDEHSGFSILKVLDKESDIASAVVEIIRVRNFFFNFAH